MAAHLRLRITSYVASHKESSSCYRQRSRLPRKYPKPTRDQRLKQAKIAQAEIKQYRLQRGKEFKTKEAGALGYLCSGSTEVEKDNQKTILQTFWQNKDEVLDNLWSCLQLQPEIHEKYHINRLREERRTCSMDLEGILDAFMEYEPLAKFKLFL